MKDKKPLYKKLYHKALKPFINLVTLRDVRKNLMLLIRKMPIKHEVALVEKDFPANTVLIFQHQMFDVAGNVCFNGGAERYVTDLADILLDAGYFPVLIQIGNNHGDVWTKQIKNLKVIGLSVKNVREYRYATSQFTKYKFVIYSGALDFGKKIHPNILISHGVTWDVTSKDVKPMEIFNFFKGVDVFVSVDTNTISWLRTTFSKTLKKIDANYIPNYVDVRTYYPVKRKDDGKIHITFPRRASPERGYWLMSASLPPILDKYPNVIFKFVGFAHGEQIQQDILSLEQKYPGRVSHCMVKPDEMPYIYQHTDISLIPTIYCEGTSLSCLEAQACGNVVISTNIGGLPNLVLDGYNGLLINPNGQELMKALDKVLSDTDLRKKLTENAVNVSKAFDKTNWVSKWQRVICAVTEKIKDNK